MTDSTTTAVRTLDIQQVAADGTVLATVARFDEPQQVEGILAFLRAAGEAVEVVTTPMQFRSDVITHLIVGTGVRVCEWDVYRR
jgi:hypothetical protein